MFKKHWVVRILSCFTFFVAASITKDLVISLLVMVFFLIFLHWIFMMLAASKETFKSRKLRNADLDEINTMEGVQFEKYLAELFKVLGYKVQLTAETGDFGADLILNDGDSCTVIQAKRYKNKVGIKAVQEILGAKAYYKADHAWVVTNSEFTNAAMELADTSGVTLYNRSGLLNLMDSAGLEKPSEKAVKRSFENYKSLSNESCPVCSSPMILRTGGKGVFYGCTTFPKCNGTKNAK